MPRVALIICLFLLPTTLAGQGPQHARFDMGGGMPSLNQVPDSLLPPPAGELGMAMGGLLAGITGFFAGGFAGAALDRANGCEDDWCGFWGGILGATAGTAVAIPLGVHLSNNSRGNYGRSLTYSLVTAAAGWAATYATQDATPLLLIPLAQIIVSVATEKATTPAVGL